MIEPFLALSGLAIGTALGYLAQEEVSDGKRYFHLAQVVVALGLALGSGYSLSRLGHFPLGIIAGLLGITLALAMKYLPPWGMLLPYLLYVPLPLLLPSASLSQLIAVLLFIYGFPTGSLLWHSYKP